MTEDQVLAALDNAGLPGTAGRDRARRVLKAAGIRVGNTWLAEILKRRQRNWESKSDIQF